MTETLDDDVLTSRTGAGLRAFIEAKTETYEISPVSSGQMLTAVKKALEVEQDGDQVDVLALDLDELFERFRIKNSKLTDQSLAAYKSRFKRATTMYSKWLAGETWKPPKGGNKKPTGAAKAASSQARATSTQPTSEPPPPSEAAPQATPASRDLGEEAPRQSAAVFPYQVYLTDANINVTVELPPTFSARDAAKLTGLINALATPADAEA